MTTTDGLVTIRNLNYDFKDEYINVYNFQTMRDPRMLRFEEQNIALESKIRLEKEDIKNILSVKMNKNIGVRQHQNTPVQYQNVVLPKPQSCIPLPQPNNPPQLIRRNIYRGIGMGGMR
jgi:hypothetical protein